jgi:hypothetical protein
MEDFIKLPEDNVKNQLKVSFSRFDSLLPFTLGTLFRPDQESCLIVLFVENASSEAHQNLDIRAKNILAAVKNSNVNTILGVGVME